MEVLRGDLSKAQAMELLGRTRRTINRYVQRYLDQGFEGLRDRRRGNNWKLAEKDEKRIVQCKLEKKHRSARFIRDRLGLLVHEETVRRVLVKHHLNRISLPPVKPIKRFEARHPNELWQIDIMGEVTFPLVGDLPLIAAIGNHSRFISSGRSFYRKFGINGFMVMYEAFIRYGLPEGILSDKGSQFKAWHPHGQANYEWYAKKLGIEVIYASKARTKGKIEALFRFIQRDFVLEHLDLTSIEEINGAFERWLQDYNFNHSHRGINRQCPADLYTPSLRKLTSEQLEFILVHEEPRKVLKTGMISYYGHYYRVPDAYIGRRVWRKLKGRTLSIECGGERVGRYEIEERQYQDVPRPQRRDNSNVEK
jgi:putative transposase